MSIPSGPRGFLCAAAKRAPEIAAVMTPDTAMLAFDAPVPGTFAAQPPAMQAVVKSALGLTPDDYAQVLRSAIMHGLPRAQRDALMADVPGLRVNDVLSVVGLADSARINALLSRSVEFAFDGKLTRAIRLGPDQIALVEVDRLALWRNDVFRVVTPATVHLPMERALLNAMRVLNHRALIDRALLDGSLPRYHYEVAPKLLSLTLEADAGPVEFHIAHGASRDFPGAVTTGDAAVNALTADARAARFPGVDDLWKYLYERMAPDYYQQYGPGRSR